METNSKNKKVKKIIISLAIIVSILVFVFLLISVLLFGDVFDSSTGTISLETTTSVYEQLLQDPIPEGEDDCVDVDTTPIPISISDEALMQFEDEVSSLHVDYDYENVYNIDKALEIYKSNNSPNTVSKHSHDIRVNGKFDADYFYKLVKKNNEAFLETAKEDYLSGMYEEYSDKQLKEICSQMCEALEEFAESEPDADLDTVCCYLYNIVIIGKTGSLDFGGFTMDNRFYLNYDNMETGSFAMDTDNIELTTFYHEMMHAFQFACDDMKKQNENRVGITYVYNELEINPLSWYWLLEASAEMNMSQYLDVRYSTYKAMITYVDSLNFISNLGPGDDLIQLEKLCFQRDINKLFDETNMTSDEEKIELIKMMYSIEILQESDAEFYNWYENEYNVDLSDESSGEPTKLCLTVKEDAILTMTKMFYKNLAFQVNSGDVTLQDCYYLMRLWEADISRHFTNNTVGYMMFFHEFYDNYLKLQNSFFKMTADENDMDFEKLQSDFSEYSTNAVDKSPNCDLKFLSNERIEYIENYYVDSYYKKGLPGIKECQEQTKDLCEKYSLDDLVVLG